ncbi:MAG: ATP synthase F1 subunit delta, partial [Planctomycetota bacterium]
NFLNVLLDRKREDVLWVIPEILEHTVNEKNGVSKVVVQTAIPITGERLNSLKRQLDKMVGRTVSVKVVNDPNILGGMILRIGNKIIDGSVAGRLKNLRARLLAVHST